MLVAGFGKMTAELLESRGVSFKAILPELKRRLELVKLSDDVLSTRSSSRAA